MTTDVTNVQNSYQMILRMCFRAPMMLIFALIMSFTISKKLSSLFLVAIVFLGICLALIISNAHPVFMKVFKKYDDLNASVQENVNAIRVVKAYVREDHEIKKFEKAADLPLNTPNSNESPAITTITPPTINTCFILPVDIPSSIKVDINSGINNSIITSNVTNIGVIIDAFLYSLT